MLRYLDHRHADTQYEADLKTLIDKLSAMCARVNAQYTLLTQAATGNSAVESPRAVSKEMDKEINDLQIEIDQRVHALVARNAPQLAELRFVLAASKIAGQFERMGDHCKNIIKRIARSREALTPALQARLNEIVDHVAPSMRALEEIQLRFDEAAAKNICESDDAVDDSYKAFVAGVTAAIRANAIPDDKVADAMFIAKNLERLADHATVIAREYMYIHSGLRSTEW